MSFDPSSSSLVRHIGVSPFAMQLHSMQSDPERHRVAVELCSDAGVKLIRDEIHWCHVERDKGRYSLDDQVLQNVRSTLDAGIEPMIILNYGNGHYDGGNAPASEEAVRAFAGYCEFMVRSFRNEIRYWEVWNEPNIEQFWKPMPDSADYANLLKAAYDACKRANPECVVIGCATSGVPADFIEDVLKAGGAQYMDALSVHPYRYPASPEASDLAGDLRRLREIMDAGGAGRLPVWITEIGWPTHEGFSGVTPERQADMLVRAYIESISSGVETVFWYWFGNDGPDPTYNEDNFGIRFADGSPKPAYAAYAAMSRCMEGARHARSLRIGDPVRAHVFTRDDAEIIALWCTDGVRTLSFRVGEEVTVAGASGDISLIPMNGVVTLTLTETPRYLISRSPIKESDILTDSPFEFEPGCMSAVAGEEVAVGVRALNAGDTEFNARIKLLSEDVVPAEHRLPLVMGQEALLLSMVAVPPRGDSIHISAEVKADGRLCALLELPISIIPPALIEIVPDHSEEMPMVGVEVRNSTSSLLDGMLDVGVGRTHVNLRTGTILPGEAGRTLISPGREDLPPDTVYSVKAMFTADSGAVVEATRRISFLTCVRAKSRVILDGKLDEWSDAVPIHLNRKEQMLVGADTWKGPNDCSALVYTMWDDDYFYIAAEVRDDVRSAELYGEKMNYNDGIEFYLDTDLLGDRQERHYSSDDFQYGCFNSPKGPVVWSWQPHAAPSPGGELAFVYDESLGAGGYVIEARIPMSEFGLKPVAGLTIGFTVAVDDDDSPGQYDAFQQNRHVAWAGSREKWLDPTLFAQITFADHV